MTYLAKTQYSQNNESDRKKLFGISGGSVVGFHRADKSTLAFLNWISRTAKAVLPASMSISKSADKTGICCALKTLMCDAG
jgi:hypothetical protein